MDEDELQDDLHDGDEDNEDNGSGSDNSAPPSTSSDSKPDGKRVNDLMSKWQSSEAEKAKLQARLDELEGQKTGNGGDQSAKQEPSAEINEFLDLARSQARQTLYASDPRLARYGIEVTAIEGTTAKEMQDSLAKVKALLDKVEGSARTSALREHGLSPEIGGGGSEKPLDFSSMSDKEILEAGDRVLGRL